MEIPALYEIIREIITGLAAKDPSYSVLPEAYDPEISLNDLGLDITNLPEVAIALEARLGGRKLGLDDALNPEALNAMCLGDFLKRVQVSLLTSSKNPIVVYVDDEEENIFIFKRKFGKRLNIKAFVDSVEALEFIKNNDDVALVITDEVMPAITGNELCDRVHKSKPFMKFILITGNPNSDGDLLYKSLRQNRFFEFINKPVDFEGKGEEYLKIIKGAVEYRV